MTDQLQLREELKERNSTLYELTIDEAMAEMHQIEQTEKELELVNKQISELADLGFFGYSHPGSLTSLFYGYPSQTPVPRNHTDTAP